jgi:hypothetical protein
VSSKHQQLVELLSRLGDRAIANEWAIHIHSAIYGLYRGYDIGRDDNGFYARPRLTSPAGPAKELRDLAASARKALRGKISREDWMRTWAAQPQYISRACRPFLLLPETRSFDEAKLCGSFSAPGFNMIVPKPDAILLAIDAETREHTGNKKRKPDLAARNVIVVIRSAYRALTGKPGGRTISAHGQAGRLVRLGQEIDRIFGVKVFPKVDSRRLEKDFGDKNPF